MPQLGFLGQAFSGQISTLEYVKMLSFIQNEISLNLGPKMPALVIFEMKFEDL